MYDDGCISHRKWENLERRLIYIYSSRTLLLLSSSSSSSISTTTSRFIKDNFLSSHTYIRTLCTWYTVYCLVRHLGLISMYCIYVCINIYFLKEKKLYSLVWFLFVLLGSILQRPCTYRVIYVRFLIEERCLIATIEPITATCVRAVYTALAILCNQRSPSPNITFECCCCIKYMSGAFPSIRFYNTSAPADSRSQLITDPFCVLNIRFSFPRVFLLHI